MSFGGNTLGFARLSVMTDTPKRDDELTEAEKQERFTRTLKRMLETPPDPHKPKETGRGKPRPASR